jgi:methyl-accepting chemotaxis protein
LINAQRAMTEGQQMGPMNQQIADAGAIVNSIRQLQKNYDDIRNFYKTLIDVVTEHNTNLALEISEILGHVQFQDVVRQRIERVNSTMDQRNQIFKAWPDSLNVIGNCSSDCQVSCAKDSFRVNNIEPHVLMQGVLEKYLADEKRHAGVDKNADDGLPKLQLF